MEHRKNHKELRHSRKTVKWALNDPYPPMYRRKVPFPERVLGLAKHIIDTYLKEDEKRYKKQRQHIVRRIYHRLIEENGFEGSESTVRRDARCGKRKTKRGIYSSESTIPGPVPKLIGRKLMLSYKE